jgi:hypothetical protein
VEHTTTNKPICETIYSQDEHEPTKENRYPVTLRHGFFIHLSERERELQPGTAGANKLMI